MIDYIHVYKLQVGPLTIHPFGLLVAIGVAVGVQLAKRRGLRLGLPAAELSSFIGWMLVAGFIGGHVLDEIFYHPAQIIEEPWSLLYLWAGLSSFGGFTGALIGVVLWKFYEMRPMFDVGRLLTFVRPVRRALPLNILPYGDVVLAVFPIAWVFGRMGCTVVHDHPGLKAGAWMPLSVAYGPGPVEVFGFFELRHGNVPRYDLGLLEMLFAVLVSVVFAATWKRRLPVGWYAAVLPIVYAPVRFGLDFLRLDDPAGGDLRYGSLTPAQWACIALFLGGLFLCSRVARQAPPVGPAERVA
jgi:phosphatidylglycerol---prolipoprotein diacylglyceryl transferase